MATGIGQSLVFARCSQSVIMSGTSPATAAYAADHSSPEQRTKTMAHLGTANSMGMILGPAISGALATLGLLAPCTLPVHCLRLPQYWSGRNCP
jgi:MFS family permease